MQSSGKLIHGNGGLISTFVIYQSSNRTKSLQSFFPSTNQEIRTKFTTSFLKIPLLIRIFSPLQEDLLIHGDSVYDIIDKQDHNSIQSELSRSVPQGQLLHHNHHHHHHHHHGSSPGHNSPTTTVLEGEQRMFLCRMNVSRNARRQMRFGDQKVRKFNQSVTTNNRPGRPNKKRIAAVGICGIISHS